MRQRQPRAPNDEAHVSGSSRSNIEPGFSTTIGRIEAKKADRLIILTKCPRQPAIVHFPRNSPMKSRFCTGQRRQVENRRR